MQFQCITACTHSNRVVQCPNGQIFALNAVTCFCLDPGLRVRPMTHDPSSWSKFLVRETRTRNLDRSFARETHKKLVREKWCSAIRRKRCSSGSFVVYDE